MWTLSFPVRQMEEWGKSETKPAALQKSFAVWPAEYRAVQNVIVSQVLVLLNSKDLHLPKAHSYIKESRHGIWYLLSLNTYLICISGGKDGRSLETICLVCLQIFAVLYRYTLWLFHVCREGVGFFMFWDWVFGITISVISDNDSLCVCIYIFFYQVIYQCFKISKHIVLM